MLTILRNNKENLLIKIILGVIVLVFIFFFGSSTLQQGVDRTQSPASVNGVAVNGQLANVLMGQQQERLKSIFKDKIPENFLQSMQSSVVNNLINQELIHQELTKIGLQTTRQELASFIKNNKQFYQNGKFDLNYYQNRYLPGYKLQTGSHYETDIMKDLAQDKFFSIFDALLSPTETELKWDESTNSTKFKFSVIKIRKKLSKTDETEEVEKEKSLPSAEDQAKEIYAQWKQGKKVDGLVKKYKANQKDTGELNYTRLKSVFGGKSDIADVKTIASLSKKTPFPANYFDKENFIYLVKLIEKKTVENKKEDKTTDSLKQAYQKKMTDSLTSAFITNIRKNAKIKVYE
jgi:hypothetical protein